METIHEVINYLKKLPKLNKFIYFQFSNLKDCFMKKLYTCILGLFVTSMAFAQPLTSQWIKKAGVDYVWFNTTDNNLTSIAYNPVTDRLLVSKRNDRIFIVNPATGAEIGTLNTTGWGTEAFKANKIRVTEDGVIYAFSMATTAGGTCKIYRWADQTSTPTLCASFTVTERCGDSFGISGTGTNTILYASGSGTTSNSINIYMLNTLDGLSFSLESKINLATTNQQWANRTVEPVTNGLSSDLWIKMGGGPARRITVGENVSNVRTGTLAFATTDGVGNGQASNGYGGLKLLTTPNNNKFLIFAGGNNTNANVRTKVLNVTNETTVTTYGLDSLGDVTTYFANANGSGDAATKNNGDGTYTIFSLFTNGGLLATTTTTSILPVTISSFNVAKRNKAVAVTWTTETEINNSGFEIQKSINGVDFSTIGFVATKAYNGSSSQKLSYSFQDNRLIAGKSFYRLKQIDKDGKKSFSEVQLVEHSLTNNLTVKALENPVRNQIVLNVKSMDAKNIQINVTNSIGMMLYTKQINVAAGENNFTIPTTQLPKGTLYVQVTDVNNNAEKTTLKVIKL